MLNHAANDGATFKSSSYKFSSIRHRVLGVIDVPFILITGRDRFNRLITYGELAYSADLYANDLEYLKNHWGNASQAFKPFDYAMLKLEEILNDIENGRIKENDLVENLAYQQPAFVLTLGNIIIESFGSNSVGECENA